MTVSDTELVARLQDGDHDALGELYDKYGSNCYSLARRILRDPELSQDVVQEVFLALWKNPHSYKSGRGSFSSWVLSLTHHKAVDSVRREESHRRRLQAEIITEQDETPGPAEETWARLESQEVRKALQTLPEPQKEALVLAYFGGYTQQEVSTLTGTPLGTVKSRMLTGMRRLRSELGTRTVVTKEGRRP